MVRRLKGWLAKEVEHALFYLVLFAHFGAGFRLITIKPNISFIFIFKSLFIHYLSILPNFR